MTSLNNQPRHSPKHLWVVLLATFVTFCTFYAPQPLLPFFSIHFGVPATSSALLITVTFIFLCIAPMVVGYLLGRASARIILLISVFLLGLLQIAFTQATDFSELLFNRTLQSFLYPAIFTAAVTYCAKSGPAAQRTHRVSLYIATTITGGLIGRLMSGFLSTWFDWTLTFHLLGWCLLACVPLLFFIPNDETTAERESGLKVMSMLIKDPRLLAGLALIFSTFFAFSATLNALPFRMVELEPAIAPAKISLVYAGYIICIFIAARATQIATRAGSATNAMRAANGLFLIGVLLMAIPDTNWLIGIGLLTSAGAFLIHATLNGQLVALHTEHAGYINGLYISTYYLAGAAGSLLPLWLYNEAGWIPFLILIFTVSAAGFLSLRLLAKGEY